MAGLLKLIKYKPTDSRIAEAKRMADNYVKTHTDEDGQVSDPNVYLEAINALAPYSDDLGTANKIADFKNKALSLTGKIDDVNNSVTVFKMRLEDAVTKATSQFYTDPRGLFMKLAEIYATAQDEFDEKVVTDALNKLPKGQTFPQTILTYQDELKKKTNTSVNLANSFLLPLDPETNLPGPRNTDAYGVMIQTNPQTGAIISLNIQEVSSLEKAPTGYLRTDARYGRIPIYLNYSIEEKKQVGKLGDVVFSADKEQIQVGMLLLK